MTDLSLYNRPFQVQQYSTMIRLHLYQRKFFNSYYMRERIEKVFIPIGLFFLNSWMLLIQKIIWSSRYIICNSILIKILIFFVISKLRSKCVLSLPTELPQAPKNKVSFIQSKHPLQLGTTPQNSLLCRLEIHCEHTKLAPEFLPPT